MVKLINIKKDLNQRIILKLEGKLKTHTEGNRKTEEESRQFEDIFSLM